MELKKVFIGILLIGLVISTISCVNAFSVTGKQNVTLSKGENKCQVTVTNTDNTLLIVDIKPTFDQYFIEEEISFPLNVRWDEIFNKYEWREIDWIDAKNTKTIVLPGKKEDIDFTIEVPDNITSGTLYAKVEVKDVSEKEGMIVMRNVYVSQVVGNIETETEDNKTQKEVSGFTGIIFILSIFILYIIRRIR